MRLPLLACVLSAPVAAQTLQVPPGPHAPGAAIQVVVGNDTSQTLFFADTCGVRVVRAGTGEYQGAPLIPGQVCDAIHVVPPGGSQVQTIAAPGEAGSYVAVFLEGSGAVGAFDVVAPDAPVPAITVFPHALRLPQNAHQVDFGDPASTPFDLGNAGALPHTFAPGETLFLTAPGDPTPLATLDLGGVTVGAGKVAPVTLPLAGLPPGPYAVVVNWQDPGTGGTLSARHGVIGSGARIDLHLPSGHGLAPGAPVRANVGTEGFPSTPGNDPTLAVLLSLAPGTTTLPDGTVTPLVHDGLLSLSLGGIGGLLQNHVQVVPGIFGPGSFFGHAGSMTGVELHHPGIPGLTGLEVRMGAVGFDPPQVEWGASQSETIVFL